MDTIPPLWRHAANLPTGQDRIKRYKQFLNESAYPKDTDIGKKLDFIADPHFVFENFEQVKKDPTCSALYSLIIQEISAFGQSEVEIESYVLLTDKIAMTVCIELENVDTDEKNYFAAIKSNSWSKNIFTLFNLFKQCLFLKLCSIVISNNTITNTKQDVFSKLCDDESIRIGRSIGFNMPLKSFYGMWMPIKKDEPKQIQQSNQTPIIMNDVEIKQKGKIDWKQDERLIPFLFYLLNEANFINVKEQFATIAKHFSANGKDISRVSLKSNYSQADYLELKRNIPPEIKRLKDIEQRLTDLHELLQLLEALK